MNSSKLYLPIKNARLNSVLYGKLEEICNDENVQIVEEEITTNWFDPKPSVYSEYNLSATRDVLLSGYNEQKLQYVYYLYEQYEKMFKYAGNYVTDVLASKTNKQDSNLKNNNEYKIDTTQNNYLYYYPSNITVSSLSYSTPVDYTKKEECFTEKLFKFYNKYEPIILGFLLGISSMGILLTLVLTIKHFMVG